jgi:hypothetical protein
MQGLFHQNVIQEMTEVHTAELLANARNHRLRKTAGPPAAWRDRLGLGLIHAGVRLVSRPLEVRVRPSQPIPCPD